MKTYHRALTIAGSDSGGGAGIQADLKTFSALGCFGMSVITALTAQNTQTVTAIHPVPPAFIAAQIDAVLTDMGTDAVKIGMLHSPEVIAAVADRLAAHRVANIVLDPVMVAKSGDKLLQDDAIDALRTLLIPMADVITPNLPEASALLERSVTTADHMAAACRDLARLGCRAVLLKGGHLEDADSSDCLYISKTDTLISLPARRIDTVNAHGTGCTLSSAVAAHLARGFSLTKAVEKAKAYITAALEAGTQFKIGHGHGPVHHFHAFWP
ncbi:MAG: bifunctional hydroxymethylpyrimidine kinase/phosphomethylpyrimidine kinase [Desulfobacterales bacterium]|nr:bifunctional hydroxymethylpyrimidine kinase/phosphomethylpyrimidine kinase [Desulfobacterales bacterium]